MGRVEWRVNGLTVEVQPTRAAAALDEDMPKAKARIALEPGQNVIEVVAYNAAGLLASAPRQVVVQWDGVASSEPPALYVLAVGVNDYADGRLKLNYAAADARAFGAAMQKVGAGLFKSVEVVTLLDAEVTEARLDAAFADLGARVKPQDVFLFNASIRENIAYGQPGATDADRTEIVSGLSAGDPVITGIASGAQAARRKSSLSTT